MATWLSAIDPTKLVPITVAYEQRVRDLGIGWRASAILGFAYVRGLDFAVVVVLSAYQSGSAVGQTVCAVIGVDLSGQRRLTARTTRVVGCMVAEERFVGTLCLRSMRAIW